MKSLAWERRKKTGTNIDGILPVYTLQTSALSSLCILGGAWYCRISSYLREISETKWSPMVVCLAQWHWLPNLLSLTHCTSLTSWRSSSSLHVGVWTEDVHDKPLSPIMGAEADTVNLRVFTDQANDIRDGWVTQVHLTEYGWCYLAKTQISNSI